MIIRNKSTIDYIFCIIFNKIVVYIHGYFSLRFRFCGRFDEKEF